MRLGVVRPGTDAGSPVNGISIVAGVANTRPFGRKNGASCTRILGRYLTVMSALVETGIARYDQRQLAERDDYHSPPWIRASSRSPTFGLGLRLSGS